MKKILFPLIAVASLLACKPKTDAGKQNNSSFNVNDALKKKTADTVFYYTSNQLDSIALNLIKNDTIGITLGKSVENEPYLLTVRTKPGFVEIHEQMDDIAIIRSGHATLRTGNQVSGTIRASGEEPSRNWLCDTIENATDQKLSPGDFIIIPAMTAHQYIPNSGDTLTYWTIKVKRSKTK